MADDDHSPAVTAGPPPTADPQDPLPESNWTWRRIFIFLVALLTMAGLAAVLLMIYTVAKEVLNLIGTLSTARDVRALDQSLASVDAATQALYRLGFWLIMVQIVNQVLYLIAPSAEQAAKMMATVSAWKGGVSTSTFTRAVSADGSVAETSKTANASAPTQPTTQVDESQLPDYAR